VIWHLAQGLGTRGHEVRILVPRTLPDRPPESRIGRISIARYDDRFHSFATLYLSSLHAARAAIQGTLSAWRPDVVHAHHSLSGLAASRAGCDRLYYTFYGPWHLEFLNEVAGRQGMGAFKRSTRSLWVPAKAALARCIERAAVKRSEALIVLSTYSRRQVAAVHRVEASRVALIPGGVDLERFQPAMDRRDVRQSLGLPADGRLLVTVRRLVPRMGLEGLLRALPELPGTRLVIGGDGMLRPALERAVATLGLSERVYFAGFVREDELPRYYQAADLVVLPSVALEGFGLITLEALACGTPVVATPEGGAVDVLETLEPSWLAEDSSPRAIARAVERVLARTAGDPAIRDRCRAHAAEYSWDRMVAAHEMLYRPRRGV